MKRTASRQFVTVLLVLGAVAFGMVLAGGLGWTVPGLAEDDAAMPGPQVVEGAPSVSGLPGFADLAEAVGPAVVSIRAATFEQTPRRGMVDPFEFFFGPRRRQQPEGEEGPEQRRFRQESGGSGFVISPEGLVVTNNHVVEGADRLIVTLGERDYEAEVKGTDPATDLALLQVDVGRQLEYLRLGDSEGLRVGDWIMAIGSPLRLDHTVTVGVVSAKGRSIGITPEFALENFIQTDAAINFGNSGGPLVNLRGEVVGIATAINFGAENIGFAVPVNILKQILPQLREEGRVTRGYLGVQIENLGFGMAQSFGLEETDGALVSDVVEGEPADRAGLRRGDIILEVDDEKVVDTRDLIDYVSSKQPGTEVELLLWRDGERMTLSLELGERPGVGDQAAVGEREESGGAIDWMGIRYQEITPALREGHNLPESAVGVWLVRVEPDSPLYEENVRSGNIIAEVNGREVTSGEEFERLVEEQPSGSFLRLYVQRYDQTTDSWTSFFAAVRKP